MRKSWVMGLVLLALALGARAQEALPAEVYTTPGPHVVINGALLKAPAKMVSGSLLLPMRAVFEALGAAVTWEAATQTIRATRGTDVVQLTIDRNRALVNGKEVTMTVAPALMDGSTYVPLRFPAEAFGGDVKWNNAVQTALITIGASAPAVAASTQTGLLAGKNTDVGQALLIRAVADGPLSIVQLAKNTVVTRGPLDGPAKASSFAELQIGDQLTLSRDAAGGLTTVAAVYAQVSGTVAGLANNKLLLNTGTLYALAPDVRVRDAAGKTVPLTSLTSGRAVTLQLTPDATVQAITFADAAPATTTTTTTTTPAGTPSILTVGVVNYVKPLRAGEALTLQVTGTPKADRVVAHVGDAFPAVTLVEKTPGVYQQMVLIESTTPNLTSVPITAALTLNGVTTPNARSTTQITIDTTPPYFTQQLPAHGAQVATTSPLFQAVFDDGGSAIDPATARVYVNATDVTKDAAVTARGMTYQAKNLPAGTASCTITIADAAGNVGISAPWKVTVGRAPAANAVAVTHDAAAPLTAGQTLTVTAVLPAVPLRAECYLGDKRVTTAMTRVGNTLTYVAAYTIDAADAAGARAVRVVAFTDATHTREGIAEKAVTIAGKARGFRITTPIDRSPAPASLVVAGVAAPNTRVRVTVDYAGSLIVKVKGKLTQQTVTANLDGAWTTGAIDTQLPINVDTYTITADTLAADGTVVETAKMTLTGQ